MGSHLQVKFGGVAIPDAGYVQAKHVFEPAQNYSFQTVPIVVEGRDATLVAHDFVTEDQMETKKQSDGVVTISHEGFQIFLKSFRLIGFR